MSVSPFLTTTQSEPHPDKIKVKVYVYTLLVYGLIVAILFFRWLEAPPIKNMEEDVIEVNLGNVLNASGDEIPMASKGSNDPVASAPSSKETSTTPTPTPSHQTITSEDPDIAQMITKEANATNPTPVSKPKNTAVSSPTPAKKQTSPITPTPKEVERKPLAVFGGGNQEDEGTSNYDSYGKNNASQGIGQGEGDMGSVGGSPYSDNYNSSMSVVSGLGRRKIVANPTIEKDFSSEGIVQIQATFGKDGRFISAQQDIKNSTTTQRQLVNIALEHVRKIRLNEDQNSAYEQAITFRFVFKLKL